MYNLNESYHCVKKISFQHLFACILNITLALTPSGWTLPSALNFKYSERLNLVNPLRKMQTLERKKAPRL